MDKFIGAAFKTLARAFLVTVDINKVKIRAINKLNHMDEAKYRRRYEKAYNDAMYYSGLVRQYGFYPNMGRNDLIMKINSIDKSEILEILNSIPEHKIGTHIREYLTQKGCLINKKAIPEQINKILNKINPKEAKWKAE